MKETQDAFVARRQAEWNELESLLTVGRELRRLAPASISRFAALYRAVCADLGRARGAGYGHDVIALLDGLAARAHASLYSAPPYRLGALRDFFVRDFPETVRRNARFILFSTMLFLLPGLLGFFGARASRTFALSILPEAAAEQMEEMYKEDVGKGRDEGTDAAMAGFYVYNNVGIAFRCFATGIVFGLGSVFFLVFNGLNIGAVGGLLASSGRGMNLLTFGVGHGAFELTAIVISGAAGLLMGWALVSTGGLTRSGSLRRRAGDLGRLVLGAAAMLLVAAGIEAFWSPSSASRLVKLVVGAVLWALVILYLVLAGRGPRTEAAR